MIESSPALRISDLPVEDQVSLIVQHLAVRELLQLAPQFTRETLDLMLGAETEEERNRIEERLQHTIKSYQTAEAITPDEQLTAIAQSVAGQSQSSIVRTIHRHGRK